MQQPILLNGNWQPSQGRKSFRAVGPSNRAPLPDEFPISPWEEVEAALEAAARAFEITRTWPGERFAAFLEEYASNIEQHADAIVQSAHTETALPVEPRLKSVELPR